MGFGPLLIGYFLLLNPGVYDGFSNIIAYFLILYGMLHLRVYNRPLRVAFYAVFPMVALGLFDFFLTGKEFLGMGAPSPHTVTVVAAATKLLILVFTTALFYGIEALGKETNLPEIRTAAVRNRVFSYVYFLAAATLEITAFIPDATPFAVHATIPVVITGFVVILMNAFTIFRCFRWIGLPGDSVDDPASLPDPTSHQANKTQKK